MFRQKIGHQFATKSLEENKLGFPRPSLSTTRLNRQVYQQSRVYVELFDDVEQAERAGEIGATMFEARSLRVTDIAVEMEGESAAGYKRIQAPFKRSWLFILLFCENHGFDGNEKCPVIKLRTIIL